MTSKKTSVLPQSGTMTAHGILPANNDGYVSMMEGIAGAQGAAGVNSPTARRMQARIAAGLIPHNAILLNEQSGIGGRIVTEPVRAAMLAGYSVVASNVAEQERITRFFDEWDIWKTVELACCQRRAAGWSVLVLGGAFVRSHPAYRITPGNDWYTDYNSPLFGLPVGWIIQLKQPMGGDVFIPQQDSVLVGDKDHDSLYGLPDTEFGVPVLTRVYSALERLGLSHELIISVLSMSVQDIYKRDELNEEMDTPAGERKAARRIGGIAATRMLNDVIAIDATEEITRLQSSLTGTGEIMDIALRIVAAESGVPVSVLANTRAGLSNSDNSGDDVWLRLVEGENSGYIVPALKAIARRYLGVNAKFVPNKSQGDIRRDAEVDKIRAETALIYYNMRAITSEEARATAKDTAAVTLLSNSMPATGPDEDDDDKTAL